MKKILLSGFTILTAIAVAGLGTFALFSAREEIAGNTFATSTLDLTLNHSAGKPFHITDAWPGQWSEWEYADIYNSGDEPFEAYLSFILNEGEWHLWEHMLIDLETAGGDGQCNTDDFGENSIFMGNIEDYDESTVISDDDYWHLANEEEGDDSENMDNIRPGYTLRLCQRVGLSEEADGDAMGASVNFDEIVDAVQDNDGDDTGTGEEIPEVSPTPEPTMIVEV